MFSTTPGIFIACFVVHPAHAYMFSISHACMQKKLKKCLSTTLFHYFKSPHTPEPKKKEVPNNKDVETPTVARKNQVRTRANKYARPTKGMSKLEVKAQKVQKLQKQVKAYADGSLAVLPTPRHHWNGSVRKFVLCMLLTLKYACMKYMPAFLHA